MEEENKTKRTGGETRAKRDTEEEERWLGLWCGDISLSSAQGVGDTPDSAAVLRRPALRTKVILAWCSSVPGMRRRRGKRKEVDVVPTTTTGTRMCVHLCVQAVFRRNE